jgi:hypothetical protein
MFEKSARKDWEVKCIGVDGDHVWLAGKLMDLSGRHGWSHL